MPRDGTSPTSTMVHHLPLGKTWRIPITMDVIFSRDSSKIQAMADQG